MEICWIDNYECVVDYNNKIKKYGLKKQDINNSKLVNFVKENPNYALAGAIVVGIGVAAIADITINGGITIACSSGGFNQIDDLFKNCIAWVKKALVATVIFNTIKDAIMILWRNSGGKMSWDDIFGSVF